MLVSPFKKLNGNCLQFEENPIEDAISRIRFAPASNNLLISSWDTVMESKEIVDDVMYPITSKWSKMDDIALAELDPKSQAEKKVGGIGNHGGYCSWRLRRIGKKVDDIATGGLAHLKPKCGLFYP
ncbi:hypothetical protein L1887_21076 [Cichorium endivia]|nr:hypothetical protein L1887_21076 [Cichorium endivia]